MKSAHLSACPACARHVRVSESACPFCGTALSEAFRAQAAPRTPTGRLSRAALYAFGASTFSLAAACGGTETGQQNPTPIVDAAYGGPPVDGGDSGPAPAYGGPPIDGGDPDAQPAPMYGGPPVDSGPAPAYGGPPTDGGWDAQGGALYGAPPHQ